MIYNFTMIYDFIKLIFGTSLGSIVGFFRLKALLNYHDILSGILGIIIAILTIIFLILQIRKIILDIKIKRKHLKK